MEDIQVFEIKKVKFRIPSLEQYLLIYKTSIKDEWRSERHRLRDKGKINFIENQLNKK